MGESNHFKLEEASIIQPTIGEAKICNVRRILIILLTWALLIIIVLYCLLTYRSLSNKIRQSSKTFASFPYSSSAWKSCRFQKLKPFLPLVLHFWDESRHSFHRKMWAAPMFNESRFLIPTLPACTDYLPLLQGSARQPFLSRELSVASALSFLEPFYIAGKLKRINIAGKFFLSWNIVYRFLL